MKKIYKIIIIISIFTISLFFYQKEMTHISNIESKYNLNPISFNKKTKGFYFKEKNVYTNETLIHKFENSKFIQEYYVGNGVFKSIEENDCYNTLEKENNKSILKLFCKNEKIYKEEKIIKDNEWEKLYSNKINYIKEGEKGFYLNPINNEIYDGEIINLKKEIKGLKNKDKIVFQKINQYKKIKNKFELKYFYYKDEICPVDYKRFEINNCPKSHCANIFKNNKLSYYCDIELKDFNSKLTNKMKKKLVNNINKKILKPNTFKLIDIQLNQSITTGFSLLSTKLQSTVDRIKKEEINVIKKEKRKGQIIYQYSADCMNENIDIHLIVNCKFYKNNINYLEIISNYLGNYELNYLINTPYKPYKNLSNNTVTELEIKRIPFDYNNKIDKPENSLLKKTLKNISNNKKLPAMIDNYAFFNYISPKDFLKNITNLLLNPENEIDFYYLETKEKINKITFTSCEIKHDFFCNTKNYSYTLYFRCDDFDCSGEVIKNSNKMYFYLNENSKLFIYNL
jgi:hypothetical protein